MSIFKAAVLPVAFVQVLHYTIHVPRGAFFAPGPQSVKIVHGEVSEWPKETVSKTVVGVSPPWVRIPPSHAIRGFVKASVATQGKLLEVYKNAAANRMLTDANEEGIGNDGDLS